MNYKVKVNNEAESKEVQLLGEQIGYVKPQPPSYISMKNGGYVCLGFNYEGVQEDLILLVGGFKESDMSDIKDYKELTIQQLKDLVVLKRNSIDDVTHKCETKYQKKGYLTSDNIEYFWNYIDKRWHISSNSFESEKLKPISPLKEYLVPQDNGKYALTKAIKKRVSDWVEIPSGANYAYNNDQGLCFLNGELAPNHPLLAWQRHTQPEELQFVDDEPKHNDADIKYMDGCSPGKTHSLNNTYAEIEQVRQDALSIQVGGNHYKNLAIQPVEFAMQNNLDYCQANAIKYIVRHADKNGKEDLLKAKHYIDLLIQHHYTEENN